jgi:hypothetical protein
MNKRFCRFLTFYFLMISPNTRGQWKKTNENDPFDGKFVKIQKSGISNSPFNQPLINFIRNGNQEYSFYISAIGFTGCDNAIIKFKFKDNPILYFIKIPFTNRQSDTVFFDNLGFDNEGLFDILPIPEIIKLFNNSSSLTVRYTSDCTQKDIQFSLLGSKEIFKNF